MNREIKYKVAYKSDERLDTEKPGWIISKPFTLHSLQPGGDTTQFDFSDGSYLGTDDVDWKKELKWLEYTGLKDKNNTDIWVGDILRYGYLALNDIEKFGEEPHLNLPKGIKEDDITTEMGIFEVKPEIGFLANIEEMITRNPDVEGVEVIGNIYENPELLSQPNAQEK